VAGLAIIDGVDHINNIKLRRPD